MVNQLIFNGLAVGSLYALMALSMVIIYKTTEVPNFAQGEMAMVAAYTAYTFLAVSRLPFALSMLLALLFAFLLGVVIEFVFLRRAKNPTILDLIILTLGLQLVIHGIAGWKWGAEQKHFPFPISDTDVFHVGSVVVSVLNLTTIITAVILMSALFLFYRYTKIGVAMKATQQNPLAARINGIRTNRITALTWGISSFIGAVAAILFAPIVTLDPNLMWDPLIKGFAAAVLGGMTSLPGSVLGGLLLGLIENFFGAYISLEFKSVIAFLIIIIVLWFKPSGLFSRHYERKV